MAELNTKFQSDGDAKELYLSVGAVCECAMLPGDFSPVHCLVQWVSEAMETLWVPKSAIILYSHLI